MFCRPVSSSSGLSLLETVTSVAVILLLSALAFPQIGRYWQAYQLDSSVQTLSSNLEVARYTAISRRRNVVASFAAASSLYEMFEDTNGSGTKDAGEASLGTYPLSRHVLFNGNGLLGPPSSPSGAIEDPITFSNDKIVFNPQGKLNGGIGSIYLQNLAGDASAISYNMASRMKIYRWDKATKLWR
jgi:Tfp pilus assembly protein FimT